MAAIDGTFDRLSDAPVRGTGSRASLLPSLALHGAVAAAIWLGLAGRDAAVAPPATFVALVPAVAPQPEPEPLPLPPSGLRLPQPTTPEPMPPAEFTPPAPPEIESFPFDPEATRPAPPEEAVAIEKPKAQPQKAPEKPKPKPVQAKPKPVAKPKETTVPKAAAGRSEKVAPDPAPSATASTTTAPKATPAAPAANPTQAAAAVTQAPVRITRPNYAGACPISYPRRARERNQQGTVVVHVLIGADGKPVAVTVAESSGHRLLDEAARGAIADCTFVPLTVGGRPVQAIVEIPIPFKLI